MSYNLSLIACPAKSPLSFDDVDVASRAVAAVGAETGARSWLSAGEAWQIAFAGSPTRVRDSARAALSGRPLDINVLPTGNVRKRLLLADMDSTLIQQECIDELAAEIGLGRRWR
jgi:phosphoserine phosphatase